MGRLEYYITTEDLNSLNAMLAQNPMLAKYDDDTQVSPLMLSCVYKKPAATSLLLKYLDKIDIFEASAAGKFDMVAYLVYSNPELVNQHNDEGFTPLALACYFGHYEVARYLAFKGADVNQALDNGLDIHPIHLAVAAKHTDIVHMLIEHNVQLNVQQSSGITPLHYAAKNGDPEMLAMLLENGADLHIKMEDGLTPADLAREKGFEELAQILS
ncbi:ankyrin repeat domain-containing protein [Mucilaginibacter robiniae]|uniref:Ankyrin repeat domain-containing protein n=1 Tax=Mucilaginibacter robiniae TaxID=2728022 RepID=A0A7L5DTR4_9SPHI|nr:ankyrin repeat domain-containing protein [Mucilaginibacter robiniae]QJD94490.1 ankyrin repeat domain-containing protein [Mucilaginibacter robiniae]